MRRFFIIGALLLTIFLFGCTSLDDESFDYFAKKAEDVIFLIHDGEYEAVEALFSESLIEELEGESLSQIEPLLEESGAYQSIKKVLVDETEEITEREKIYFTATTVEYENKNRTYTMSFNEDEELVGFYIK